MRYFFPPSHRDGDVLVRAPGLEPKSSSKEPFLLLKEISTQCLEDICKGKTGTVKQLLTLLSGVNIILPQRKEILIDSGY